MNRTYRVFNVSYDIEDEEVLDIMNTEGRDTDDPEEIQKEREIILKDLPTEFTFEACVEQLEGDGLELEEYLGDQITGNTGWCILGFDFERLD